MGVRWSGSLVHLVEAAEQRQAYNNFRKVRSLFAKLVNRSPVLSGAYRASWKAGYGAPTYNYVDVGNKRAGMISLPPPDFGLEYDQERAWHMYVTNGSPYASEIEFGSSAQAPAGVLRMSVKEVFRGR